MGSCFSVEDGEGGERKEPTETSQVAPFNALEPAVSGAAQVLLPSPSVLAPAPGNAGPISGHFFCLGFAWASRFLSLTIPQHGAVPWFWCGLIGFGCAPEFVGFGRVLSFFFFPLILPFDLCLSRV